MWRLRPPLGPSPVELDDSGDELPVHKRQRRESSHPAAQASAAPFWQHASTQEDVTTALAAQGAAHGGVCLHLPPDIDEADDPFSPLRGGETLRGLPPPTVGVLRAAK